MKLFECQSCGQLLYFENTRCERCGSALGYLSEKEALSALVPEHGGEDGGTGGGAADARRWLALGAPGAAYRFCANADRAACNWLVPADGPDAFCPACRLNRTIPDLSVPGNLMLWRRLEGAKHRLVYGLLRLGLPLVSRFDDPEKGLAFDFLSGARPPGSQEAAAPVFTGHAAGVITIDVAEADPVERERQRRDLVERYRTLLGHFRHEVGHYYWDRLVRGSLWHRAFRELFGDERRDYAAALRAHYAEGPPADWQTHCVSSYAAAHPWEDFAETWAHYLHIVDTLETAWAFGLQLRPAVPAGQPLAMALDFDAYRQTDFDALVRAWLPLTYAVNSLNQSMGQPNLYPFVLAPGVQGKLRFVHGLVHGGRNIA